MKTIDLKKFYSKPELYDESNLVDVTDEVAYVLEQSIRDERNSYMKCYRAKAYYSLDYGIMEKVSKTTSLCMRKARRKFTNEN